MYPQTIPRDISNHHYTPMSEIFGEKEEEDLPTPTYKKIQEETRRQHGFTPKTCWIADVKEEMGLPIKKPSGLGI